MKEKGTTLMEIVISLFIFSLFMFTVYAVFETGMKSWQMGSVKSDLYQKAQVALSAITKDFRYSNWVSVQIDNNGDPMETNEYISFETPVNYNDGSMETDTFDGSPVWQGYVLYYIYPRWETDASPEQKRDLYRHFKPRSTPSSIPKPLDDIMSAIDLDVSPSGDEIVKTVVKEIYSINLEQYETELVITVVFKKNLRKESSVVFTGSSEVGTEIMEYKTSVIPYH